jgi:PIN domain nuclease of toxin-antitoxin system
MAALIYLDTHVAAWLHAGRLDLIPTSIRNLLDEHDLLVSPAVKLELQYLFEIRRTAEPAQAVLESLESTVGLKTCDLPFAKVVDVALSESWTRDPFDRLIVGQARLRDAQLVSKDGAIRDHYPKTVWG